VKKLIANKIDLTLFPAGFLFGLVYLLADCFCAAAVGAEVDMNPSLVQGEVYWARKCGEDAYGNK